jgi:Tol biopolymer transport system component
MDPFETRLTQLLVERTEPAVRTIDALAVARTAMAGSGVRRSSTGGVRFVGPAGFGRRRASLLALVTLGLLAALVVATIASQPTSSEPLIEKLFYVDPDVGLVLQDPPGSTPKVLVAGTRGGSPQGPSCFFTNALTGRSMCWSSIALAPSGRYLALQSVGNFIDVLTIDGREVAHFADMGKGGPVRWSPVDDVMAVVTDASSIRDETQLGIVDPDGTITKRITLSIEVKSLQGWSPDGRHVLVFGCAPAAAEIAGAATCKNGGPGRWDVWAVDIAAGESVRLTDTPTVHELESDWSPDGSQIAYTTDCGDAWTPDGPCPWSIWTARPDGSDARRLTPDDQSVSSRPIWAPDGKRLAYTSSRAPVDDKATGPVYTIDADGSNVHRVTELDAGENVVLGWSPDGSTMVVAHAIIDVAAERIEAMDTWLTDADGSDPRVLVPGTFDVDWTWVDPD